MTTRNRITTAMAELLRQQGYAATGIQQLATAAGAPTGSIYHHFKGGKRDVAAAALAESGRVYAELVLLLLAEHDELPAAVLAAFEDAAETMESTGWANLCPVGTVLGEVAGVEPELRAVGAGIFGEWVDAGAAYFVERGLPEPSARDFTLVLVSTLEGAFILARTQRSREPLLAAGRLLSATVASLQRSGAGERQGA